MNSNSWIESKGLKRIKLEAGVDCNHFGPMGMKYYVEGKKKDNVSTSESEKGFKLKIKGG